MCLFRVGRPSILSRHTNLGISGFVSFSWKVLAYRFYKDQRRSIQAKEESGGGGKQGASTL